VNREQFILSSNNNDQEIDFRNVAIDYPYKILNELAFSYWRQSMMKNRENMIAWRFVLIAPLLNYCFHIIC